jgi:sulfatase modifying factor 1
MAKFAVTNAEFAEFVAATGYETEAERFGWSSVFRGFVAGKPAGPPLQGAPWWVPVTGACWRQPDGPDSTIDNRMDHPVVHVSWGDAAAYAHWAGGRLPSEAEWEHAARGGLAAPRFPWGDEEPSDERPLCNIWQGRFPDHNSGADGYLSTAPVDAFEPNGQGLHNMAGNTWEWCADPFRIRSLTREARERDRQARLQDLRVLKGGSYLCHRSYCYRYRIAARTGSTPDTATAHVGFRLAYDCS